MNTDLRRHQKKIKDCQAAVERLQRVVKNSFGRVALHAQHRLQLRLAQLTDLQQQANSFSGDRDSQSRSLFDPS